MSVIEGGRGLTRRFRIHVIERGTVVESGSHRKLLKLDGRYAKLVAAQMLNA